MQKELLENHKRYLERRKVYKNFGYDIEEERKFILDKAQPLYGDMLEVGTGKGYFTVELAREGRKFTSVDISEDEQRLARLNIEYFGLDKQVDFKIEDAEHLSFEDKSFDVIFSINTIHHFSKPFRVIDELIRIVSFEGKIILSDFTEKGLEAIDKVHASEGRIHEAGKSKLRDVEDYLLQKRFKTEKDGSSFQEILIAYHPVI